MISGSTIAGMLIALTMCFMVPGFILFWLMIKRKAKRIIYMLIFGILAGVPLVFIQAVVKLLIGKNDTLSSMNSYLLITINDVIYAALSAALMIAIMFILKNDGLTYNRALTISVGFSGVQVILAGLNLLGKFANAISVNDGTVYDTYSEEAASKIVEKVANENLFSTLSVGFSSLAIIAVASVSMVLILYGMSKDKLKVVIPVIVGAVLVNKLMVDILTEANQSIVVCIIQIMVIIGCVYVLGRIAKIEKDIMIKPRSMMQE